MDIDEASAPFDRTYDHVTRRIVAFSKELPPPDVDWLNRLIEAFAAERKQWGVRPELAAYRIRLTLFRTRLLRLVAGAYLHISYDLPRAMADEWPGKGRWSGGPPIDRGRQIYFQLSDVFPAALVHSASDFRTVGLAAIFQRRTAEDVLAPAAMWVDYQRQGAWLNAEFLSKASNRAAIEIKMAEAMTAALDDASLWRPWSLTRLRPPTFILRSTGWISLLAVLPILDEALRLVGVVFPTAYLTWRLARARFRLETVGAFVNAWGMLTAEYVGFAVREPAGFDAYRARRREELGIVPRGAAARG